MTEPTPETLKVAFEKVSDRPGVTVIVTPEQWQALTSNTRTPEPKLQAWKPSKHSKGRNK